MRVTIIRGTNTVAIDALAFEVDCSSLPADVHAVQWDGASGEVEYGLTRCTHCGARSKKGNSFFTDVAPYQPLIDAWTVARDAALAAAAAEAAAAAQKAAANAAGPQS